MRMSGTRLIVAAVADGGPGSASHPPAPMARYPFWVAAESEFRRSGSPRVGFRRKRQMPMREAFVFKGGGDMLLEEQRDLVVFAEESADRDQDYRCMACG
jgi:hypothetical protein